MELTLHRGDAVLFKVRGGLHLATVDAATAKPNVLILGEGTKGECTSSDPDDGEKQAVA